MIQGNGFTTIVTDQTKNSFNLANIAWADRNLINRNVYQICQIFAEHFIGVCVCSIHKIVNDLENKSNALDIVNGRKSMHRTNSNSISYDGVCKNFVI